MILLVVNTNDTTIGIYQLQLEVHTNDTTLTKGNFAYYVMLAYTKRNQ